MPVDINDLDNRVGDGYIRLQNSTTRRLASGLRSDAEAHLLSGGRSVDDFSRAIITRVKEYALANVPGITDAQVSQFIEPIINAAEDVERDVPNAKARLYNLFDRLNDQSIDSATNENIFRSIASATATGGAMDYLQRIEDLNTTLGVNETDLSRLDGRIQSEVRRRYI